MKKILVTSVYLLIMLAQILLFCELGIRSYEYYFFKTPFRKSMASYIDPKFGWIGRQGVISSPNPKFTLLVVGDSYTNGEGVSSEFIYFNYLKRYLRGFLFAYGGPGFGNLQEYLVIDEYIDLVKPDLILWQVCGNDFENNSWEFEKNTPASGNILKRPYIINGKIEYRYPRPFGFLNAYSRFFYRVSILIEKNRKSLMEKRHPYDYNTFVRSKYFPNSYESTSIIAQLIKRRAGQVPVVAFMSDSSPERTKLFAEILQKNNIPFIDQVPDVIAEEARKRNKDLSAGPGIGHWSAEGHLIVAQFLINQLVRLGYFPAEGDAL